MKLYITFVLVFLMGTTHVFSQNDVDSLKRLLNSATSPAKKLPILVQLGNIMENEDLAKAKDYYLSAIEIGEQLKDTTLYKMYLNVGRVFANTPNYDSASVYFEKAFQYCVSNGILHCKARSLMMKAYVSRETSKLDESIEFNLEALSILLELKDSIGIARAYEEISCDLYRKGKADEAMEYALISIDIAEKVNAEPQLIYSLSAAGNAALLIPDGKLAYDYYDKAIKQSIKLGYPEANIALLYNDRGNALKYQGRFEDAILDYKKVIASTGNSRMGMAEAMAEANLGDVYMKMKDYPQALTYKLKSVKRQEEAGMKSNLIENYLHISNIYEEMGNYALSLEFHKKYSAIKDTIMSTEKDAKFSELLTKYETVEKDSRLAVQQAQISRQSTVQLAIIGVVAALIFILFLLYRNYLNKQKLNAALSKTNSLLGAKNNENELLLKEIHHRVKNNLQTISSLLNLQSANISDVGALEAVKESQSRVSSMALIHQKLYQGERLAAVEMKDYFNTMGESIFDSFGIKSLNVAFKVEMDNLELDVDTAIPVGLIVNELITNSLKYAFPDGREGLVQLSLNADQYQNIELKIKDNGIGINAEEKSVKQSGFGTRLVQLLTMQLEGEMEQSTNDGITTIIRFKRGLKAA
ncbi:MAG: tetratricopeptide repeat protein [Saprospiraceae bacterium]|nr:tetratricopeptide repeat protein [Saprospiraceae bacterium]